MSDYGSLLERLRRAEAATANLERAFANEPHDLALELDLLSARSMSRKLHEEFLASAPDFGVDVCHYRIVPEYSNDYSVAGVAASLLGFQEIFSLIFAALKIGPRNTARMPEDMAQLSALSVGYTFAGSLGIVLTVEGAKTLFGDLFDETAAAVYGLMEIKNQEDVRLNASRYGKAVVTKFYQWSRKNYERSYALDIRWKGVSGNERGRFLSRSDLARVMDNIGRTSEVSKGTTSVLGVLAGGDIVTRRFHLIDDNDVVYRGGLSPEFKAESLELGRRYVAHILVEATAKYAAEEEDRQYTLLALERDPYA